MHEGASVPGKRLGVHEEQTRSHESKQRQQLKAVRLPNFIPYLTNTRRVAQDEDG